MPLRDKRLQRLWQRGFSQMGLPVVSPEVTLPAGVDYQDQVTWQKLDDLLIIRRFSGAHSVRFSRPSIEGGWANLMVLIQVMAGSVHVADADHDVVIGPETICIRDFGADWKYNSAEGTV